MAHDDISDCHAEIPFVQKASITARSQEIQLTTSKYQHYTSHWRGNKNNNNSAALRVWDGGMGGNQDA